LRIDVLPRFVGERNFHNYTRRVSAASASARRTILDFNISDPFCVDATECVLFTIRGKSFMLNQIRKMLGVVVAVARGAFKPEMIEETFGIERWAIPKLPGDGLMLDKVEYTAWMRVSESTGKFLGPMKDVEFTAARGEVDRWKETVLFPHIVRHVSEGRIFEKWVQTVLATSPPMPMTEMDRKKAGQSGT
jgi:tRNA pseudouridine38-40 synthase